MIEENTSDLIKRASWIGIVGNAILSLMKISVGVAMSSLALIGDGIDSLADIVTSLISLFTSRIMSEPPDKEHPWGHGRAEIMATRLIGFLMFLAGFQLLLSGIEELRSPTEREIPNSAALIVIVISVIAKAGLAIYKTRLGRRLNSSLLKADGINMRNDVFLSLGVLGGIILCRIFNMMIFDSLMAVGLALYILKSAVGVFRESDMELMDGMEDPLIYDRVFNAVEQVEGAENPHRCRIRQIGTLYDIDLDIEVEGSITVVESHRIAHNVEMAIKESLPNIYDIMVHVEPSGFSREREQYGLSPVSLKDFSNE
jgi:cation diffusion facilitator family transporter